jgi:hypothetical protein
MNIAHAFVDGSFFRKLSHDSKIYKRGIFMGSIIRIVFTVFIAVFINCSSVNTTYKMDSFFNPKISISNYSYLVVAENDNLEPSSQLTLSTSNDARFGNAKSIIEGYAMKCGFSVLSFKELSELPKDNIAKVLIAKWGISGRNSRTDLMSSGAYSQEVTVILSDYTSKEIVYRGIGEYMGRSELDDIKGALSAAMQGLCSER